MCRYPHKGQTDNHSPRPTLSTWATGKPADENDTVYLFRAVSILNGMITLLSRYGSSCEPLKLQHIASFSLHQSGINAV
jgi:hypothetical protein